MEKRIIENVINRFICTMYFVFGANLCSPCKKANYLGWHLPDNWLTKAYLFDFQAIALASVRLYLQRAMSLYNRSYAFYQSVERVIGIRFLGP